MPISCTVPRLLHADRRKQLLEIVDGIAFFSVDFVISRDPFCLPIGASKKPHLKESGFRPLPFPAFIPKLDFPFHALARDELFRKFRAHGGGADFSAVPHRLAFRLRQDAISGLFFAALAVPKQHGLLDIDTQRVFEIFRSQADGFHAFFPSRTVW